MARLHTSEDLDNDRQRTGDVAAARPLHTLAKTPHGLGTFLVTSFGKPFTANGFGNWFRERRDEAGLPHCASHGLRKAGAVRAAEKQMMALLGWDIPKLAAHYAKQANQKKLTAQSVHTLVLK